MLDVVVENELLTGNVASNLESRVILYDMQLFERSSNRLWIQTTLLEMAFLKTHQHFVSLPQETLLFKKLGKPLLIASKHE